MYIVPKKICPHDNLTVEFPAPEAYQNSNVRLIRLRVICSDCDQPLRFIGIDEGSSLVRPCTSPDGFTIHIPGVMGCEDVEHEHHRLAS